jgi:hypothetical protein
MNDRDDVIERMVDQYRDHLAEQYDEDLLGSSRLEGFREDTKELVNDMLESLREETIEELVEQYQKKLESTSGEELLREEQDDSED